jgi:hypothetical protein
MAVVDDPKSVYQGLRQQILRLDPVEVGLKPTDDLPAVWGLMMETGHQRGTSTLVALADGTTSLYLSSGGGIIGGGQHDQVVVATMRLLALAEVLLPELPVDRSEELPRTDRVVLRALTYAGPHAVEAAQDDLGYGRHRVSELFHAGHDVITELRLVHEAAR